MTNEELIKLARQDCDGGDCGWPPGVECKSCWAVSECKKLLVSWQPREFKFETKLLKFIGEKNGATPIIYVPLPPKTEVEIIVREKTS